MDDFIKIGLNRGSKKNRTTVIKTKKTIRTITTKLIGRGLLSIQEVSVKKRPQLSKVVKIKYKKPYRTFSFQIAGMQYALTNVRETKKVLKKLKEGSLLKIKHEPKNKFDNYACALYFENSKLGYIPKDISKSVIQLAIKNREILLVVTKTVDFENFYDSFARPTVLLQCF